MSTDNTLRVVREPYEAFQRGDIQGVVNAFAPAATWFTPGAPDVPFAGVRRGRDEIARFFTELDAALEFLEFAPREFYASGETVIVIGHARVRVRQGGEVLESDWAHVMHVQNDQITDFREFEDTAPLAAALRRVAVQAT